MNRLTHRHRGQAPSHSLIFIYQADISLLLICFCPAFDLAFDLDLRRPIKHAGRTQAWIRG